LGIVGHTRHLDRRIVRCHDLLSEYAIEIVSVDPDGPAKRARIQERDLVIAINNTAISTIDIDDVYRLLAEWPFGNPVTITIVRGRERSDLEVTLVEALLK
jgi:C-terminal processing protease CtpA/Prc